MTGFAIVCLIASEFNCWQLAVVFVCWLVGFVININFAKIFYQRIIYMTSLLQTYVIIMTSIHSLKGIKKVSRQYSIVHLSFTFRTQN